MLNPREIRALVALTIVYCVPGCTWGEEARLGATFPSPDSAYVARYFEVAGGGAAGFVAQVVDVRPTANPFKWSRWRNEAVFVASRKNVAVRWTDDRHVVIEYADYDGDGAGRAPATAVPSRGPISLSYHAVPDRPKEEWERGFAWVQLPRR